MRSLAGRMSILLTALALLLAGLIGAYRYWESYYEHRGFTPVALLAGARPGRRVEVRFYSPALGRESDYLAYLPPGYNPARQRYPVYYLLHGSPGRPQVYTGIASLPTRLDNLLSRHRLAPMILVFPDGRIGGSTYSDSEWANTRAGRYESYVIDVVHDVDSRFATIPQRSARVIAGFSAGGYGAVNVTLHNLGVFGNVQSWSGYYRQSRVGVFARASRAQLEANSPLGYVSGLAPALAADPLRAFLFVGRDDNVSPQEKPMAVALARAGAQVGYALYKGGHDWQLWHAHLNQMLILASRDVSTPLRAGRGAARTLTPGVIPLPHGIGRRHGLLPIVRHRHRRRHRHHRRRRHRHHRQAGAARAHHRRVQLVGLRRRRPPRGSDSGRLLGGLLLALVSAALINLGFLLQQRGLRAEASLAAMLRAALRTPVWLTGQVLGWIGFATQIVAVAIAPLALVQAFAAGGLALSVPLAARLFHHRVSRRQRLAVLLMAASLAALPLGYGAAHDQLHAGILAGGLIAVTAAALLAALVRRAPARAIAAGGLYGVADAAIKAVSVRWGLEGAAALVSVWTVAAALGTFAGFLAFQTALRDGGVISAISLMSGLAALVALVLGLLAFGESLGSDPLAVIAHLGAIAIVLACVPELAAAQAEIAQANQAPDAPGASPGSLSAQYGSPS